MSGNWEINIDRIVEERKIVTLSKKDFPSKKDAIKHLVEALNNISFDDIHNWKYSDKDESIQIDGDYLENW